MTQMTAAIRITAQTAEAAAGLRSIGESLTEMGVKGRAGATATAAATGALTAGVGDLAGALSAQAAAIGAAARDSAAYAAGLAEIRAALNPIESQAAAARDAIVQVTAAEELGAVSASEAALMIDRLTRALDAMAARAQAAGLPLQGMAAGGARAATGMQQLIDRLTGVSAATGESVADQLRHGQALDQLRARFNPLFAATMRYEEELRDIAEAERLGAISAIEAASARDRAAAAMAPLPGQLDRFGTASGAAAAYAGQLTFQLNDIAMMLAAGQNPMMLMMQQGPQVTQVFEQMRGQGMALGPTIVSAFRSMLHPVNLITMAVIGFGGAAIQWLTSTSEEAGRTEDQIDRLKTAVQGVVGILDEVDAFDFDNSLSGMEAASKAIRREFDAILDVIAKAQAATLQLKLDEFRQEATGGLQDEIRSHRYETDIAGRMGNEAPSFAYMGLDSLYEAEFVLRSIYEIEGNTREELLRSVNATAEKLQLMNLMTPQVQQILAATAQELGLAEQLKSETEGRVAQEGEVASAVVAAYGAYARTRTESEAALAIARDKISTLQAEAEITALIHRHGADSAEVTLARAVAEREAYATMVDALDVADGVKRELMSAYDAARLLSGTNISATIAAALGPASRLGDLLWRAANAWDQARARFLSGVPGQPGSGPDFDRKGRMGSGTAPYVETAPQTLDEAFRRNAAGPYDLSAGAGGGGGGGGGARGDSVASLSEEAKALLADLDLRAAAVAEKVRAGLVSVGEGAREMGSAKERAAGQLADLIARLDRLGPAGKAAADAARASLADLARQAGETGSKIQESLTKSFEDSFAKSLATGQNAMSAFADHVQMELARAFTQKFITPMISPLIGAVTGLFGFAVGGVPDAPALAAHSNTIVDRPTPFAMAGGNVGIMGEAGAEAIMPLLTGPGGPGVRAIGPDGAERALPLTRAADGALGVQVPDLPGLMRAPTFFAKGGVVGRLTSPARIGEMASGSGLPSRAEAGRTVIVNNNAPATKAEARERQGADGMYTEVVIEQIESAIASRAARGVGAMSGMLSDQFGLSRVGR